MNARDQTRALRNGSDGAMKECGYQGKMKKTPAFKQLA